MQLTIHELASLVHGRVHGPATRSVSSARPLNQAGLDDVAFLENERHAKHLKTCRAGVLLVPGALMGRLEEFIGPDGHLFEFVEVDDPLAAFVAVYRHINQAVPEPPAGIDPRAAIDPTARIGPGCTIMAFASVGANAVLGANCVLHPGASVGPDCRLGDGVILHAHVSLYRSTTVGHRTIIHANAVLGADGFGYRFVNGQHVKVPQLGHVEVGDDVEIGAGTTIDRGTFQATVIGSGTKIDNLVQIGHNCRIGRHNIICGLVGIAGSCETGDFVILAGGVGVADHVRIGERTIVGAGSGVPSDVEADKRVLGYPCRPEREALRVFATMGHLPDMWRDLRQVKQQLAALTAPPEQERKAG